MSPDPATIRDAVRDRYATAAPEVASEQPASCCGPDVLGSGLYATGDRADLPDTAVLARENQAKAAAG